MDHLHVMKITFISVFSKWEFVTMFNTWNKETRQKITSWLRKKCHSTQFPLFNDVEETEPNREQRYEPQKRTNVNQR